MKNYVLSVLSIIAILLSVSCSKEEINDQEIVSGSFEFTESGLHDFEIDARNITATITIIGAGGGGGGGSLFSSGLSSTGGGGGGGAGEVIEMFDVSLDSNLIYHVVVGTGGAGGTINNNGSDGLSSKISLSEEVVFLAIQGEGGHSNGLDVTDGGNGGFGFPNGNNGTSGNTLDLFFNGDGGLGGEGGDNLSLFGTGGKGGDSSDIDLSRPINEQPGENGTDGYVLIEWVGIK